MIWTSFLLPPFLKNRLFGDRERFGLVPDKNDQNWMEWQSRYVDFYMATQKGTLGKIVNHSGYRVLKRLDFEGKKILEIGPGVISHYDYWKGTPQEYYLVDVQQSMLTASSEILNQKGVKNKMCLVQGFALPAELQDGSFDILVTFNSLEHLFPLDDYLKIYSQCLKPGGLIVGAIPAEGGLAWGLGRFLTTRRWFLKNTSINPDKIICWEHPNFAPAIVKSLRSFFKCSYVSLWPLKVPWLDVNLTVRFIFRKESR